MTRHLYRGTNVDNNFPRRFNHHGLGGMLVCELDGGHPALDTYSELAEDGQRPSLPLDVLLLCFFGLAD